LKITKNPALLGYIHSWISPYANTSDYVRDLIRQDQHQQSKLEMLQAAITAGIESGVSDKSFDQIIEQVRHELKNNSA